MPARTFGLTHISLDVRDAERSARFYAGVVGAFVTYRERGWVEVQTPGSRDALVFVEGGAKAGKTGGLKHFGFRLREPGDVERAARAIERGGGRVTSRGEFEPGEPYVFGRDPDGYEVEFWYQEPTARERRLERQTPLRRAP